MSEYNHQLLGTLGVDDESNGRGKLAIQVGVDTLGMCTISFGSSYSIRIPEDDVDALRDILYQASTKLMAQRNFEDSKKAEEDRSSVKDVDLWDDKVNW